MDKVFYEYKFAFRILLVETKHYNMNILKSTRSILVMMFLIADRRWVQFFFSECLQNIPFEKTWYRSNVRFLVCWRIMSQHWYSTDYKKRSYSTWRDDSIEVSNEKFNFLAVYFIENILRFIISIRNFLALSHIRIAKLEIYMISFLNQKCTFEIELRWKLIMIDFMQNTITFHVKYFCIVLDINTISFCFVKQQIKNF